MSKNERTGQTLIELLILLLPIVVSIVLSRVFFRHIGWWGVLPAVGLGFGSVAMILCVLAKFFSPRSNHWRKVASSPNISANLTYELVLRENDARAHQQKLDHI